MAVDATIQLRSANPMPVMGLGTWKLDQDTAATVARALELGYPMIDTSGDYGTQPGIGKGIKDAGADRDAFYLVTKVEETDNAYEAVQKNLDELDIDHADLVLIHRPPEQGAGVKLWDGLMRAREEGMTRDIGVSNYDASRISQLVDATGEFPVVNQVEWSPFGHSRELLDYAREHGIVLQAYSPLTRARRLDDAALSAIAEQHGKSPAQILIRWNLQLGTVPLPKANQVEHLKQNIDVFDFELSAEEMDRLEHMNRHYSALGTLPYI